MEDSTPEGEHMAMGIYKQVLDFIIWTGFPVIMLSGGEPTRNSNIIEMIEMAKRKNIQTLLLTNGTFLENPELKDAIFNTSIDIQITNDERFYPRGIPVVDRDGMYYEHEIRGLSPIGRAIKNNLETNRVSPHCFNLRSACRSRGDFKQTLSILRSNGKMCTPSINMDGSISAGESSFCSRIGTIFKPDELIENICSLKCNKCGLEDNLTPFQKDAIGDNDGI